MPASLSKPILIGAISLAALRHLYSHSQSRSRTKQHSKTKGFLQRVLFILRQVLPSAWCRETRQMAMLMACLLARTLLSLFIAWNMGRGVSFICDRQWDKVLRNTLQFGTVTTLAAVVNATLKFLSSQIAVSLRERVTQRVHQEYMRRNNYYRCTKLGEDRLELADQLITDDVRQWSESFADVYSSIFKPVVDFFLFSVQMWRMMGFQGPIGMYLWFIIASAVTTITLPPYGKLSAKEQQLEGEFRDAHVKLIANSEMVAFMRGEKPERNWLDKRFNAIRDHVYLTNQWKFKSDVILGYVNKYFASVVGFLLMARPIYFGDGELASAGPGEIAKFYVASRQIMENLSAAVLALFEIQKKVGRLSGLTSRVSHLLEKLNSSEKIFDEVREKAEKTRCLSGVSTAPNPQFEDSSDLKFEGVSIFRPDGALLAANLNVDVPHGRRVIITGGNGCGKSSLFRVLKGLWPLIDGKIYKPADSDFYFLSQVNFVPRGTLRELLTYPHTPDELKALGIPDEDLIQCLEWAHLSNFEARGQKLNLESVMDWDVALSPGQKQRMAFARLLYHRPRYAVLDECTNGISPEVEEDLYKRCASMNISVFSISHKVELKRLHDYELHFKADKVGSYEWTPIAESDA